MGRYVLYDEIATGGMASVHFGRQLGAAGFSRTVAIKRPHPHLARQPDFVMMFVEEARLASRIRHPNVVATTDVVVLEDEVLLVMDYVSGESLSRILRSLESNRVPLPVPVALSIVTDALYGLHAAHEACDDTGQSLGLVHRDVSPQNIVVGRDGVARLVDFGIAKASSRAQSTGDAVKGKLAYMAPEQLKRGPIDRRTDVFAASIVLWEILTGQRLFAGDHEAETISRVLDQPIVAPSEFAKDLPAVLDTVVLKGLRRDPSERWESAKQMAGAIEKAAAPSRHAEVGEWVERAVGEILTARAARIAAIEASIPSDAPAASSSSIDGEEATAPFHVPAQRRAHTSPDPDVTELSHVRSDLVPLQSRRRVATIGLAVVGLAALSIIGAVRREEGTRAPRRAALDVPSASSTSSSLPSAASALPFPSASSTAPPPIDSSPPVPAPSTTRPAQPRRKPPAQPTPTPDCSTPYYFDADGVKRFKPGCL